MRLVLDWDGTCTVEDTLDAVVREFGNLEAWQRAEASLGSNPSVNDVIAGEFATVRAPLEDVVAWLVEHVRLRRGFHGLVAEHDPLILSSGFHEFIEPVLEREGAQLEVRANSVDARPDGWRFVARDEAQCTECGVQCKRGSLPPGPVVYVGDGYSDRCAAQAAERVFARGGLARFLAERGVRFEPFNDLADVAAAL